MIKKVSLMVSAAGLAALMLTGPGWSQTPAPPAPSAAPAPAATPAPPPAGKAARQVKPAALETLTGKVVAVNRSTPKKAGRPARVTLDLQTDQKTVTVHLGPASYIDQQPLKLAVGDQIEVKGGAVTKGRKAGFIAHEVKKGDQVMKLRDDATGRPLWAEGKPKRRGQ